MVRKALIVASVASMIDQFNIPNIKLLQTMGYEVDVATNFEKGSTCSQEKIEELKKKLFDMSVDAYQIDFDRKITNIKGIVKAINQLTAVVKGEKSTIFGEKKHNFEKYEFIHCHSPIGGVVGRLVAKKYSIKSIYTAHGFHFYKGAPLKNWLFFYPVELFFSWFTDILITINKEDFERSKRNFHAKKLYYVPGIGIDITKFKSNNKSREEKKRELGFKDTDILLLSVGELSKRKNHIAVIKALAKINNPNIHYIICGKGILEKELVVTARNESVNLHLLGFREDIDEICHISDLFVFPSLQEGLPVALMEAIACKIPVICSKIRGNTDLVVNQDYMFADDSELCNVLERVLSTDNSKEIHDNYEHLKACDIKYVTESLQKIYNNAIRKYGGVINFFERQKFLFQWNVSQNGFIILSVGELNDNKNHRIIINAIGDLISENPQIYKRIHYAIAGKGNLSERLLDLAREKRIESQIHLLGFREDISKLQKIADAFALPSKREGLNVSLMEAIASGKYCLASNIRGNQDLVVDEEIGCLINPTDLQGWKNAISYALNRNENFGKSKRNEIINLISSENIEKNMKLIYEGITK
ncbi:glycosyltransferase [Treponema socranskii]|uniref:glycosyltransferase n=1 Tax=Treponema socranskii TaxID=53419 RepID=UPI003D8B9685